MGYHHAPNLNSETIGSAFNSFDLRCRNNGSRKMVFCLFWGWLITHLIISSCAPATVSSCRSEGSVRGVCYRHDWVAGAGRLHCGAQRGARVSARRRRGGECRGGSGRRRATAHQNLGTTARYTAHENFSRVAVNRWRHAGNKALRPRIPFAPSSPHNSR